MAMASLICRSYGPVLGAGQELYLTYKTMCEFAYFCVIMGMRAAKGMDSPQTITSLAPWTASTFVCFDLDVILICLFKAAVSHSFAGVVTSDVCILTVL